MESKKNTMQGAPVKLVVFDLDGVILDSEWAHEVAKISVCRSHGIPVPEDLREYIGRSNRVFWRHALDGAGMDGDVDQLVREQFAMVMEELQRKQEPESPGLTSLLKRLTENGVRAAVSSGSEEYFIRQILDYLGVTQYFSCIITGNDIVNLKPAPDIYLAALRLSGIPAENAVAVEDSRAGCQAAQTAGLRCAGYTNRGENPQDLSKADCRIRELPELGDILFGQEEERKEQKWN